MTGSRLHQLYRQAHADEGVLVDEAFEELDQIDQQIWDGLALLIEADIEMVSVALAQVSRRV